MKNLLTKIHAAGPETLKLVDCWRSEDEIHSIWNYQGMEFTHWMHQSDYAQEAVRQQHLSKCDGKNAIHVVVYGHYCQYLDDITDYIEAVRPISEWLDEFWNVLPESVLRQAMKREIMEALKKESFPACKEFEFMQMPYFEQLLFLATVPNVSSWQWVWQYNISGESTYRHRPQMDFFKPFKNLLTGQVFVID